MTFKMLFVFIASERYFDVSLRLIIMCMLTTLNYIYLISMYTTIGGNFKIKQSSF